ncbi:MAG: AraC family transcriptional regulator [Gemmatimonadales bacterium]|nr:AraC family transcriptional regulator [Gemmatimonadales bacterium]
MEYLEIRPKPPLDRLVHCFWFLRGEAGPNPPVQTIVPDGRTEIIMHLGEPFAMLDDAGVERGQSRALLAGQLRGPIRLVPRGPADVVGIRFRTDAACAVVPLALHEVTGQVAPLGDTAPQLVPALLDAAALATSMNERVAALSAALGRLVAREPTPWISAGVRALGGRPRSPVEHLAAALGQTPRTMHRRFLEEIGVSPKALQSILRFRGAFQLLGELPRGRWTRVASMAGYHDQAHMIRDFRRFAGAPPSEFFSEEPELALAMATLER